VANMELRALPASASFKMWVSLESLKGANWVAFGSDKDEITRPFLRMYICVCFNIFHVEEFDRYGVTFFALSFCSHTKHEYIQPTYHIFNT
jgi:hypothetical protein